jgi:superfamily I DNA and/or RNA helicase
MVGKEPFEVWNQGTKGKARDESNASDETITTSQERVHNASRNVHGLSTLERRRLVELWVQEIHENKTDELFEFVKDNHNIHEQLEDIHDEVDRRVLQTADVIGVTTTGLAKRISVLQHVHCKVIICEEAGEVMEPHTISALLPSVEHFIQIGDHQQLRPQINNHGLSLESRQGTPYQLDHSQFERLSMGEPGRPPFPVAQLNVQRRMRPEISTLIRTTIYPRLIDHEMTKNLPDVVGMRKNVFWLDHENMEEVPDTDRHQKSRSNDWEVDMTHSLVRHIVRQGVYNSSDIAVLTPYTGQLQKLRTRMRSDFEIVLSDRDEETLARDGFNEETATTEEDQTSSGYRQKPLEKKKLSEFLRIATWTIFKARKARS